MKETFLAVTEAERSFSDCVNRAQYQGQLFVLLKNGVPVARLVPAGRPVCCGSDLAAALNSVQLSDGDAQSWNRDLREAGKKLKAPPENAYRACA